MSVRAAVRLVIVALAFGACRQPSYSPSDDETAQAAGNAIATVAPGAVEYPRVLASPEILQGAATANEASKALDAACASIPMNAELTVKRPGGTGCPRDENPIEAAAVVQ